MNVNKYCKILKCLRRALWITNKDYYMSYNVLHCMLPCCIYCTHLQQHMLFYNVVTLSYYIICYYTQSYYTMCYYAVCYNTELLLYMLLPCMLLHVITLCYYIVVLQTLILRKALVQSLCLSLLSSANIEM